MCPTEAQIRPMDATVAKADPVQKDIKEQRKKEAGSTSLPRVRW